MSKQFNLLAYNIASYNKSDSNEKSAMDKHPHIHKMKRSRIHLYTVEANGKVKKKKVLSGWILTRYESLLSHYQPGPSPYSEYTQTQRGQQSSIGAVRYGKISEEFEEPTAGSRTEGLSCRCMCVRFMPLPFHILLLSIIHVDRNVFIIWQSTFSIYTK